MDLEDDGVLFVRQWLDSFESGLQMFSVTLSSPKIECKSKNKKGHADLPLGSFARVALSPDPCYTSRVVTVEEPYRESPQTPPKGARRGPVGGSQRPFGGDAALGFTPCLSQEAILRTFHPQGPLSPLFAAMETRR